MRSRILIAVLSVALVAGVVLALRTARRASQIPAPAQGAASAAAETRPGVIARAPSAVVANPAPTADVLPGFSAWTQRFLAAAPAERASLVAEGVRQAQARRPVFKQLIQDDPRRAIETAVPMVVRRQLPPEVVAQLEKRVQATADVEVQAVSPGSDPAEPVVRRFTRVGDEEWRTFVYGRRTGQNSLSQVPVHGVAIDRVMALAESPVRVLEVGELPPADAERVTQCPVSGLTTAVSEPAEPVSAEADVVQVGERVIYMCEGGHIRVFEEEMVAAEGGTGGAAGITAPAASSFANGPRTLLYMRLAFPDDQQEPQTEAAAWTAISQLNSYFQEISFGKIYYLASVPPLIILPRSEAWYAADYTANGSNTPIMTDAKDAARRMGYNPDNFSHYTVIYTGGPGSFGGLGSVGGSNVWLKSTSLGVFAHEIGHNVGVWHGNSWDSGKASGVAWNASMARDVIGGGANGEYGNSYDVMGSSGAVSGNKGHFMTPHKNLLGWLPNEVVTTVSANGTYRIFPMDQTVLDPARRYALKIAKDADRDYWVEFRQKYNADHRWFKDGVALGWSAWGQNLDTTTAGSNRGGQFLDTTPGSADGKNDGPVVIGRTFSDRESGVHITPIAKGGTTPESIDVVVNTGDFPGNNAPVINSLMADTTTPAVNGTVSFTVDATDADSDTLAYFWDFGDATYGTNAANTSKQFTTARHHAVRCIVSDRKGGETSRLLLVTVGTPATFTASGRVLDGIGNPMPEVRIQNGSSGTSFRGAWTDSNGDYVVTNLAAGAVTLTPVLGAYTFTPASYAVTGSTSPTGRDFTAIEPVRVTVEATDADAAETGGNPGTFRLTRTGSTTAALVVYTDLQGDASTGDYTLSPTADTTTISPLELFTIPAGSDTLEITVTPVSDTTREGPEVLRMVLIPRTTYTITGKAGADVVIDDTGTNGSASRVSVVALDGDADEAGDPGTFEIRRTGPVDSALNVTIALAGTSNTAAATNGTDYASIASPVTIPAGEASVTVTIDPTNDALVEGQETVQLTVSTSTLYGVGVPSSAIVRIADDDIPTVSIAATDATATEGGADTGLFSISRTGDTTNPLVVEYTIGGAALHGVDYLPLPGTITIPAGAASAPVLIVPVDDAHGEPAQTVILQLRNDPRLLLDAANLATVTINDNDLTVVAVGVSDSICNEPTASGAFRITTTGTGAGNIIVRYIISGTATSGVDFATLTGTLSIARNTSSTITVVPINDALIEDAETVTLTLTPDPAYQVDVLQPASTLVIRDDDQANTVNVSFTTVTMAENGGASKIFLSRTGSTGSATTAGALNISYQLSGTATAGADYTALPGTATIPDLASSVSVDLAGIDDSLAEGAETIVVTILPGSYSIESGSASLIVTDNETTGFARTASFASRSTVKTEGDAPFAIPVVLSAADPVNPVVVDYIIDTNSATGSGVDTNLVGGTLTFAPGETQKNISTTVVDDLLPEMEEHLTLKIAYASNAGLTSSGSYHTLFIRDNEPRVSIAATDPVAHEQGGEPAFVTISRTGPLTAALTVNLAIAGTATSGADFNAISTAATLSAGQRSITRTLTPLTDAAVEGTETAIITVLPSTKFSIAGTGNAALSILDSGTDHPPTVRIASPAKSEIALPAGIGLMLNALVSDDGAPGSVTSVWSMASGPGVATFGDNGAPGTTAKFSAGGRYVLRCTATDVALQSGSAEVAVVVAPGTSPWTSGDIGITGTNATGADDVREGFVQNQGSGSSITSTSDSFHFAHTEMEGDGEIVARFEGVDGAFGSSRLGVMLRESTAANSRFVAFTFVSTSSVAWIYRATVGGMATTASSSLPPGPRWLRVRRVGDLFTAEHSVDKVTWTQVGTSQTIALASTLRAGIAVTSGNTTRPARGLFTDVRVTGAPENTGPLVDAAPTSTVPGAAFKALAGTAFDAGAGELSTQWSQVSGPAAAAFLDPAARATTASFPAEGDYTLRLTADDGEVVSFDEVQVQVQFATLAPVAGVPASEAGVQAGQIIVSRDSALDGPLTVYYTSSGTANSADFVALPGSLVIPAGASSAEIFVTPQADTIAEGDETVSVTLSANPGYHLPAPPTVALTLQDLPIDAWRFAQFGAEANNPAVAGPLADIDGDGFCTLAEYAFGTDPGSANTNPVVTDLAAVGPDIFLRLSVAKNPAATDITYEVLATSDLSAPASWSSGGLIIEENSPTTLRVRDSVPASGGTPRFMRAKVSQ
ncbi:MAG: Calx-beta domain-containing protein [Chthoniobacteraceae bacterium]